MRKLIDKYVKAPLTVKAALWFLICSFFQKGISIITTPIFTRLLSTSEYGQYNVFNSWLSIVTVIVTLNMAHGVYTQGLIKFSDDRKIFSSSLQGLSLVLISCGTFIYLIFYDFWNQLFSLTTVQMLAMFAMIWTSTVYTFWAADQRVDLKYKILVFVTLLSSVFKPLLSIFLIKHMDDKATARILGILVVELVFFSWMFFYHIFRGKHFFSARYWKYAVWFCIPLVPHYLSQTVLSSADRIMIEKIDGASAAGIYGLAYSISQLMSIFNLALIHTIEPWIYKKIKEKQINDVVSLSYILFGLIGIVNLALILIAPEAVKIFAPKSYYSAIWVIPPVAMSVYFQFLYSIFSDFEFYYEKTTYIAAATMVSAVLNIVLNYLFIPKFGFVAAGYTTLICYIIYTLFHYKVMTHIIATDQELQGKFETKKILIITIVFLLCGFGIQLMYGFSVLRYILIGILIACVVVKRKQLINYWKCKFPIRRA